MSRIEAASVVLILVVAFALGSLWFGGREPTPTAVAPTVEPEARPTPEPPPASEVGMPTRRLAGANPRADYPFDDAYRGQSWSAVPHELVAAHDGAEAQQGEGSRRLFIAVVEPGMADAQLERLIRDLRERHRDAEVLRVRVFDSKEAALTPSWSDAGSARDAHLLADLLREQGRERMLVRGREIAP